MTFHVFHPCRSQLEAWLNGRTEISVDRHVEACNRCASRLEKHAPVQIGVRDALIDVLAPPIDFAARLETAVAARAAAKADFELLAGLLMLPWQTSLLLLGDDEVRPPAADEGPEDERVD